MTAGWPTRSTPPARPAGRTSTTTGGSCSTSTADRSQCHDLAAERPEKLEELKALWFAEAAKYNGLPLADLNILETLTRSRPYLSVDRKTFTYYPGTAEVGIGAAVEIRGQSFSVLAEVTVDTADAQGVLFKQGAGHGGHVLFVQDGKLQYIYNFMGEDEQKVSASRSDSLGQSRVRGAIRQDWHRRGQPHSARRGVAARRWRRRRDDVGGAVTPGNVRARRRWRCRRPQYGPGDLTQLLRRRSPSPAARSRRSSSTSRVPRTSTWNENSRRRSRRTDAGWSPLAR